MITLTAFLTTTGGVLLVNALGSLLKQFVEPRWGVKGIHWTVFTLSLIAATVMQYIILDGVLPDFTTVLGVQHFIALVGTVFMAAVTVYEVVLKRIGMQ